MADLIEGPWLIQRLNEPYGEIDPSRGFDGFFNLDYMGSAEFEFGTVGDNLRRFRERGKAEVVPIVLTFEADGVKGERGAFLVISAKKRDRDAVIRRAQAEIQAHVDGDRTKEYSGFREALRGQAESWHRAVAWWALTGQHTSRDETNYAWALDRSIAERLALAFNTKKAK